MLTVFGRLNIKNYHQNFDRFILAYCDLANGRPRRAHHLSRELHDISLSRFERQSSLLTIALCSEDHLPVNRWAWLCNTAPMIR